MKQMINFVIKNKTHLLFVLLFCISFFFIVLSHSYHTSLFFNSTNSISGKIYGYKYAISKYFSLTEENNKLAEENAILKEQLYNFKSKRTTSDEEIILLDKTYRVTPALVYNSNFTKSNNYLTINKGTLDGIKQDFGVVSSSGIVGIVDYVSNKYARVLTVLSDKSKINAKIKSSHSYGSLVWNGKSTKRLQLADISSFTQLKKGDTIVTGGQSAIFPRNIPIGKIIEFNKDNADETYNIEVSLFNDLTAANTVYILNHLDKAEIKNLENNRDD